MASETDIANMALAHLGNSNVIMALDEKSNEARACLLFYEQCRDEVLTAFPWTFANQQEALGLVAVMPTTEWAYSYRYPSDVIQLIRILSGTLRVDTHGSRVPYKLGRDSTGMLIYTDQPNAVVEYTYRVTETASFTPHFVKALALRLAADIAPLVTGGDQFKLGQLALARYAEAIGAAQSNAANEEIQDLPPDDDFITVRN